PESGVPSRWCVCGRRGTGDDVPAQHGSALAALPVVKATEIIALVITSPSRRAAHPVASTPASSAACWLRHPPGRRARHSIQLGHAAEVGHVAAVVLDCEPLAILPVRGVS